MQLSDNTRKEILVIFLLLFLTIIYFNNLIFQKELFLSGDMYNFFYAQRYYAQKIFQNGFFPFWNTDIFCGVPYIADIQNAVFYPFYNAFLFNFSLFCYYHYPGYSYIYGRMVFISFDAPVFFYR